VLDLSPVFIVGKLVLQQNHRDFLWWAKWIFVTSLSVQCSGLRGFHLASFWLSAVPAHSHAFVGLGSLLVPVFCLPPRIVCADFFSASHLIHS
jgi:hypothetical protein